jgi:hypothetical protein
MGIKLKEITYMTREEAEDNYRIKWEKQIKKDMADNSALRARQRPIRPLGASQEEVRHNRFTSTLCLWLSNSKT